MGVCLTAFIEMALKTSRLFATVQQEDEGGKDAPKREFIGPLSASLCFALCTTNAVPYISKLGGLVFVAYSLFDGGGPNSYFPSDLIHHTITLTAEKIIIPVCKPIATATYDWAPKPTGKATRPF